MSIWRAIHNAKMLLDPHRRSANMVKHVFGALAQLGERMAGSHEVRGSIPLCSTNNSGDPFHGSPFIILSSAPHLSPSARPYVALVRYGLAAGLSGAQTRQLLYALAVID